MVSKPQEWVGVDYHCKAVVNKSRTPRSTYQLLAKALILCSMIKHRMSTHLFPCPKVHVLHWNAHLVHVQCPYCEEIHRHGVALPGRRTSHCDPGGQYEFVFPIDENSKLVGYEIDKRNARFVNIELQISEQGEDLLRDDGSGLANMMRSAMDISTTNPKPGKILSFENDSSEMETIHVPGGDTFEQKRIDIAISECIFGNLHSIQQYLSTSVETELFLHGRNDTGNTILIMASAEWNHEMVSLLLKHGADVNATNNDGRSALMEAALWGRIESVRALLEGYADKQVQDTQGRRAIDLARSTRKNEEERYRRSPLAAAEKVWERDRNRRHIVILLDDLATERQHSYTEPLSESEWNKYEFRKSQSDMSIALHGPIRSYRVPQIAKTAAILDRGGQFARIEATSGWVIDALPPNEKSRPQWIERVHYIASVIGHTFQNAPKSAWDHGKPGQYFASHAEKKLIAYFIDRHLFTPQDKKPDLNLENSISRVENLLEEGKHLSVAWARACDLEDSKQNLNLQLFEADDRLLGDSYDEREVARLKREIGAIDTELSSLQSDFYVAEMRSQGNTLRMLLEEEKTHRDLMELSKNEPPMSLRRAVILSSNKICEDCDMFKSRVNNYFKIEIEMKWR